MQLNPEGLSGQLDRGLPAMILIIGDEPLQIRESIDLVRHRARDAGCTERIVLDVVDAQFDWNRLHQETGSMSLFDQFRLIEVRMNDAKPGRDGGAVLAAYAENPASGVCLLLVSNARPDQKIKTGKWYKAIDRVGLVVNVWPIETAKLPAWIGLRMKCHGLSADKDACRLLADRVEGNLLACDQEISKLSLLRPKGHITAEDIITLVSDNARYGVFAFTDAALAGESVRLPRILTGLRQEGVGEYLVLWALQRELRVLAGVAQRVTKGQAIGEALRAMRIWPQGRQELIRGALPRHPASVWMDFLVGSGEIDRTIKGLLSGNAWHKLLELSFLIAQPGRDRPRA